MTGRIVYGNSEIYRILVVHARWNLMDSRRNSFFLFWFRLNHWKRIYCYIRRRELGDFCSSFSSTTVLIEVTSPTRFMQMYTNNLDWRTIQRAFVKLIDWHGTGQGYHGCHSVAYNRFYLSLSPLFAFPSFTIVHARCLSHPQPRNTKLAADFYIFVNVIDTRAIIPVDMTYFRFLVSNYEHVGFCWNRSMNVWIVSRK